MKRTAVNPWDWSLNFGYNQAEIITNPQRQLICAGQTACDAKGAAQHKGDMRNQIALSLDNLEAVLKAGDMSIANVTRISIFTTDMDETMKNYDVIGQRFGAHNVTPPVTLLGVTKLALPDLMFEIEATAMD